jgi:hypothetical protein
MVMLRSYSPGWLTQDSNADYAIVFIHGLASNSDACWRTKNRQCQQEAFWPDIVNHDNRFGKPAIFLAQYSAPLDLFHLDREISDCAKQLHGQLSLLLGDSQRPVTSYENIMFVCHSLGGVVLRTLLTNYKKDYVASKRLVLAFFSSPAGGSGLASGLVRIFRFIRYILYPFRFLKMPRLVEILCRNSPELQFLHHQFKQLRMEYSNTIAGAEFFESRRYGLNIVDKRSAGGYFGQSYNISKVNHHTIVKPCSDESESHQALLRLLLDSSPTFPCVSDSNVLSEYRNRLGFLIDEQIEQLSDRQFPDLIRFHVRSHVPRIESKDVSLAELATKATSFAITGVAGSGKSILLLALARKMLEYGKIPLLLFPRQDVTNLLNTDHSLEQCYREAFRKVLGSVGLSMAIIDAQYQILMHTGRLVYLVDALDELDTYYCASHHPLPSRQLKEILDDQRRFSRCSIIFTSRTERYTALDLENWPRYKLNLWDIDEIKQYFINDQGLSTIITGDENLVSFFRSPLACRMMDCDGGKWLNSVIVYPTRVRHVIHKETTALYTHYISEILKRDNMKDDSLKVFGLLSASIFSGRLAIPTFDEATREVLNSAAPPWLHYLQKNSLTHLHSIIQNLGASGLLPLPIVPVHLKHESFLEYGVAHYTFTAIRASTHFEFERDHSLTNAGRSYLHSLGMVSCNEAMYVFLRHLTSGFYHLRTTKVDHDENTLSLIVRLLGLLEKHFEELDSTPATQAAITLMISLRGYSYNPLQDPLVQDQWEDVKSTLQPLLFRLTQDKPLLVRQEAAVNLVAFKEMDPFRSIVTDYIRDPDKQEALRKHVGHMWGFNRGDPEMMNEAFEKGWEITESDEGFRRALRPLNILQIALWSDRQADVQKLENMKIREEKLPSSSQDDFLLHAIESAKQIILDRIVKGSST